MAGARPDERAVLFEERQWVPFRVCALVFLAVFALDVALTIVSLFAGAPDVWTIGFPGFIVLGALCALILWAINYARRVAVRRDGLQFGRRFVAFGYVDSARYVDHAEARRIQDTMRYSILVPSTWGHKDRLNGVWWQRWMDGAILVHLKLGAPAITEDWLIGTRRPQELLELIRSGIEQGAGPEAMLSLS